MVAELKAYYKKYFDVNKEEIVVEITVPLHKKSKAVTKTVEVVKIVDDQIATKECSGGAKCRQIDKGYGAMAGMHSILKVNPTYIGVDGKIYQDC